MMSIWHDCNGEMQVNVQKWVKNEEKSTKLIILDKQWQNMDFDSQEILNVSQMHGRPIKLKTVGSKIVPFCSIPRSISSTFHPTFVHAHNEKSFLVNRPEIWKVGLNLSLKYKCPMSHKNVDEIRIIFFAKCLRYFAQSKMFG